MAKRSSILLCLLLWNESVRIGLHTSIAGSLERSALKAAELGANTFQIFSSSPRQWKASVPSVPAIRLLNRAREKYDLTPLVIHDNYLINLASAHEKIRKLSIEAFRGELERAIAIGAEYLVAHPGNYKGQPSSRGSCISSKASATAAHGLKFGNLMLLIENTVGAGAQLGGRFEELHVMREYAPKMTDLPDRVLSRYLPSAGRRLRYRERRRPAATWSPKRIACWASTMCA